MRKWAAYLLCFLSLALLGTSGHFLADYAKQEEKADILQEQLKEIYENQKEETKEKPRQDELGRRMEQKTGQLKKYEDKIREQDEMIQTYANSTSWKITEPMRKIMRLLKK